MIDQKGQAPVSTVEPPILDSLNCNSIAWSLNPLVVVNNLTKVVDKCPHYQASIYSYWRDWGTCPLYEILSSQYIQLLVGLGNLSTV